MLYNNVCVTMYIGVRVYDRRLGRIGYGKHIQPTTYDKFPWTITKI